MAFSYYSPVTVNSGQVTGTLTDYPKLIYKTDARFKTIANGGHVQNANGYDIRPYSDSGLSSALTYQLKYFDGTAGTVGMRVKRSSLTDSTATYLGYGDSGISTDGSSTSTWSNNFLGEYTLGNGTILDVSSGTGSNNGTNNGATATTGQVDGAAAFASASTQYINLGTSMNPAAVTMSVWVNGTSFPNAFNGTITRIGSASNAYIFVKSNGKLACGIVVGVGSTQLSYDGTGTNTLSTGTWYYLTLTYSDGTNLLVYVNGSLDKTTTGTGAINYTLPGGTDLGRDRVTSGRNFNGAMYGANVSSVVRSVDWITAEYNQGFPATFETLGTEVPLAAATNSNFLMFM